METHQRNGWRRRTVLAAASALVAATLAVVPATGSLAADIWSIQQQAARYEADGDTGSAAELWEVLLDRFLADGSFENAALYAKDLGRYYDGLKDYERAIRYYEIENDNWLKAGNNWGAADMQRAEEIRLTLDLYVSVADEQAILSQSAAANGKLALYEPAYGAYLGLYSESDPEMGNYFTRSERFYNKKHAIYLAYTQWGKTFPAGHAANAKQAGGALQIGFEPDDGLDEVEDGAYIRQWAREAKASGIPIFLRYASEMNGAWTKWNGDPEAYIEKWRLVHAVMKEEAPNVAMVWSPGDVPRGTMDAYYPGDDYVDWVGVSLYTEPYEHGNLSVSSLGISPVERLDELYSLYADRKPIMISETAVAHTNHKDGQAWTGWARMNLERLYSVMTKKYPRLKAVTYFNRDQGQANSYNDYLLRHNDGMMDAYKALIADPYFLTRVQTGAKPESPVGYRKAEGTVAFAKKLTIAPYIKIPDIHIGRVEYLLNGAVLAEKSEAPYAIALDAGSIPDGAVLEAAVYQKDGVRAASRSIRLEPAVSVSIDGKEYSFEQPPVIRDGSTLAPVRAIFHAMGAEVEWDPGTRTVTGRKGERTVSMTIGNTAVKKGSETMELPVPAQLVNGHTMVPARFVGEAFGGEVTWDVTSKTVIIKTK